MTPHMHSQPEMLLEQSSLTCGMHTTSGSSLVNTFIDSAVAYANGPRRSGGSAEQIAIDIYVMLDRFAASISMDHREVYDTNTQAAIIWYIREECEQVHGMSLPLFELGCVAV